MLRFADPQDAMLADRYIRPLCFVAPGNEYCGLDMIDWTLGGALIQRRLTLELQGSSLLFGPRARTPQEAVEPHRL